MIKVSRSESIPKSIQNDNDKKISYLKDVFEFFADESNKDKTFEFKGYNSLDVKNSLESLFSKKCAYCESRYSASSILDVEHFRPKGQIQDFHTGTKIKPGYFWLAWDWNNLLPSCINCNRRQYRKEFGKEELKLLGKGELFPLVNEAERAKNPGEEHDEECLLLNPCIDLPEDHLMFLENGIILPTMIKGVVSEKGRVSIEIYGLDREDLVFERNILAKSLTAQILTIERYEILKKKYPNDFDIQAGLENEISELQNYLSDDRPFLGMVRQLIKKKYKI